MRTSKEGTELLMHSGVRIRLSQVPLVPTYCSIPLLGASCKGKISGDSKQTGQWFPDAGAGWRVHGKAELGNSGAMVKVFFISPAAEVPDAVLPPGWQSCPVKREDFTV